MLTPEQEAALREIQQKLWAQAVMSGIAIGIFTPEELRVLTPDAFFEKPQREQDET